MKTLKYMLLFFLVSSLSFAQSWGSSGLFNPRATALGNTYTVSSQGVYTIGINPANLAIPSGHTVEISTLFPIPNWNFSVGNDFLNIDEFSYFFTGVDINGETKGKLLNDADKQKFIDLFKDGSQIRTGFSIPILSFSVNAGKDVGSFGFGIYDQFGMKVTLPIQLFDFALNGNPVGKKFDFNDLDLKASYLRTYSFSYAHDITDLIPDVFENLSVGLSLKFVKGYAHAEISKMNTTIETLEDHSILLDNSSEANIAVSPDFGIVWDFEGDTTKNANIGPFPTPAGSGVGFDIGFSAKLDSVWSFGIALTDIGKVNWENEIVTYSSTGQFTLTKIDSAQLDSLGNSFKGEGKYGSPFSSPLPTALRLGAAFRLDNFLEGDFPGKMLIVAGLNQGFNNEINNSKTPRFSLGFEWKPADWFPIRSGFSFGGVEGFNWGFGFGLDTGGLSIDFAAANLNSLLSLNSAKKVGISLGSRFRF